MRKKSQSIRTRLLLPIFAILVIQCGLFILFVVSGGFVQSLKDNNIAVFNENTENEKLYLEQELVHRWMQTLYTDETVMKGIEKTLADEAQSVKAINVDSQLNKKIMENLAQPMIELLHRSYGTGVFVVLNGPVAENSDPQKRAGLYIRDLDSSSYVPDNSDLLLERGVPSISRACGIPLDSFWELGFTLPKEADYYYNPIREAILNQASWTDRRKYLYVSPPFSFNPMDTQVITCSIPLITQDHRVIGVMGLDMTLGQLENLLGASGMEYEGNTVSVLGVRKNGEETVEPAAVKGILYEHYFSDPPRILWKEEKSYNIDQLESEDGTAWFANVRKIEMYDHNTPFDNEEWVLTRMVRNQDLLGFYKNIQRTLVHVLLITLLTGITGAFVIGHIITDPISRLIGELRKKPGTGPLSLTRLSISEIDELTEAIEKLSVDVAESASRISSILEHANVPIGVYEFKDSGSPVFCSRTFFEMMRWEHMDAPYRYVNPIEFAKRMRTLSEHRVEDGEDIYYFEDPVPRWLRLITVEQENGSRLGVFSDVTGNQLDKLKLERERDFDLLTNLYNRRAFREKSLKLMRRKPQMEFAVVMWDMDNLKYINDTYGHDEGDRYIMLFAEKLHELERGGGIISRYAGDEFVTLLYDIRGADGIRERINRFMDYLHGQVMVLEGSYRMPIRVSAGLAWYPKDSTSFDSLITYADFAMYVVKHSVKGSIMEFNEEEYANNSYLLAGQEELNRLFEQERVAFAYQPIADRRGALYGYELLMRPQLENLKNIFEVLNLAKAQAKLIQMESLTWRTALASIHEQTTLGNLGTSEKLFINSIASVRMQKQEIEELENRYGDRYFRRIVMELTENEQMDMKDLEVKLELVKKWGASLAIDDFGSGYNGESVLLSAKPDIVKLDMTLVRNLDKDKDRQMLLKNIIGYAKRAGMVPLAEGVETEAELEILMNFGVELFQGYYIGRPEFTVMPIDARVAEQMKRYADAVDHMVMETGQGKDKTAE